MKRMSPSEQKKPNLLAVKSKREPLSTRVKTDTKKVLKVAAKEVKTSVSDFAAAVLDDYADWLDSQRIKTTRQEKGAPSR